MNAYAASRIRTQGPANVTRHAVDDTAYWTGALDTQCGVVVVAYLGPWQSGHPRNCTRCAKRLERQEGTAA